MKEGTYTITPYEIVNLQNQLVTGLQINYYNLRNELINIEEYIDEESIRLGYFPKK